MATLGIRKTSWQGLSVRDKTIIRRIGDILALGVPAEYAQPNGDRWYIFADHRFKATVMAYFGCVVANLGDIPAAYTIPEQMEAGEPVEVLVPVYQTELNEDGSLVYVLDGNGDRIPLLDEHGVPVMRVTYEPGPLVPIPGSEDLDEMRVQIKAWCEDPARTNPLVKAGDVAHVEGGNFWQEILDAQQTPASMRMADSVPDSWSPVEVTV